MKGSTSVLLVSSLVLAIGTVFAAGDADAQATTRARRFVQNPAAVCRVQWPTAMTKVRIRPKAVQNEGTQIENISCSWRSQGFRSPSPVTLTSVQINLAVNDGVADVVQCTGYDSGNNLVSRKTVSLPASGASVPITFVPADFGTPGDVFVTARFNAYCLLNPGVGINATYVTFAEDVGT